MENYPLPNYSLPNKYIILISVISFIVLIGIIIGIVFGVKNKKNKENYSHTELGLNYGQLGVNLKDVPQAKFTPDIQTQLQQQNDVYLTNSMQGQTNFQKTYDIQMENIQDGLINDTGYGANIQNTQRQKQMIGINNQQQLIRAGGVNKGGLTKHESDRITAALNYTWDEDGVIPSCYENIIMGRNNTPVYIGSEVVIANAGPNGQTIVPGGLNSDIGKINKIQYEDMFQDISKDLKQEVGQQKAPVYNASIPKELLVNDNVNPNTKLKQITG